MLKRKVYIASFRSKAMGLQLPAEYREQLDEARRILEEEKPAGARVEQMFISYWDSFTALTNPGVGERKEFPVGYGIAKTVPETNGIKRFLGIKQKEVVLASACYDLYDGRRVFFTVSPNAEAEWAKKIASRPHPLNISGEDQKIKDRIATRLRNSGKLEVVVN